MKKPYKSKKSTLSTQGLERIKSELETVVLNSRIITTQQLQTVLTKFHSLYNYHLNENDIVFFFNLLKKKLQRRELEPILKEWFENLSRNRLKKTKINLPHYNVAEPKGKIDKFNQEYANKNSKINNGQPLYKPDNIGPLDCGDNGSPNPLKE
ncbi:hypothetical protein [Fulvivirga sp.]|uniref:hypothetical protein n=1 Tax=Fulvivirga sp. TaxID=1931237 RepID=UPI0032EBB2EF